MFFHSGIHMACRHTNVCVIRITRTSKLIHDIRHQSKRSITLERKIRGSFHGSEIYVNVDIKFKFNQVC